jgi:hypothetical protein
MNFPIANALELGELFLRRFDRQFSVGRRSNDDRPLAAAEKLIVSGDFVHEADAIARHLSSSQSGGDTIMVRERQALMIWINFGAP